MGFRQSAIGDSRHSPIPFYNVALLARFKSVGSPKKRQPSFPIRGGKTRESSRVDHENRVKLKANVWTWLNIAYPCKKECAQELLVAKAAASNLLSKFFEQLVPIRVLDQANPGLNVRREYDFLRSCQRIRTWN